MSFCEFQCHPQTKVRGLPSLSPDSGTAFVPIEAVTTKGWDMLRYTFAIALAGVVFLLSPQAGQAQASKRLEGKTVASPPQSSWDQVDQINREADKTRARHDQSRQAGGLNKRGYTGGNIKVSSLFPKAPKTTPKAQKPAPQKK
jgi:hypothetical protein